MRNPFRKQPQNEATQPMPAEAPAGPAQVAAQILPLDFAPNDPLSAYLLGAGGSVDLERLKLDSPALDSLREAGVKLIRAAGRSGRADWTAEPGAAAERAGVHDRRSQAAGRPGDPGRAGRARGAARPPAADRGAGP